MGVLALAWCRIRMAGWFGACSRFTLSFPAYPLPWPILDSIPARPLLLRPRWTSTTDRMSHSPHHKLHAHDAPTACMYSYTATDAKTQISAMDAAASRTALHRHTHDRMILITSTRAAPCSASVCTVRGIASSALRSSSIGTILPTFCCHHHCHGSPATFESDMGMPGHTRVYSYMLSIWTLDRTSRKEERRHHHGTRERRGEQHCRSEWQVTCVDRDSGRVVPRVCWVQQRECPVTGFSPFGTRLASRVSPLSGRPNTRRVSFFGVF